VCGVIDWRPLPNPGPQSMASDWRVVHEPLARYRCAACGVVRRWPGGDSDATLFAAEYVLYAHPPGEARERARQAQYAAWIASMVPRPPKRILDVGCGNGSLLLALAAHWPDARLTGCDPSAASVAHGAAHGLDLWQGTAEALPSDAESDAVVSVNVIEHVANPLQFLERLRDALTREGLLILVCPDGGRASAELLVADHVHSFAPVHLSALCRRAGLDIVASASAPPALGSFQMVVARRGTPRIVPALLPAAADARAAYLSAWSGLDVQLLDRVAVPAVCFGVGEAAGLLRAYAPRTWARIRACTLDGIPTAPRFGSLPIVALDSVAAHESVLIGVRPLDQPRVAERLRSRFSRVITWYDLVGGDGVE
jgi:SAM-dependent methyltransferase